MQELVDKITKERKQHFERIEHTTFRQLKTMQRPNWVPR